MTDPIVSDDTTPDANVTEPTPTFSPMSSEGQAWLQDWTKALFNKQPLPSRNPDIAMPASLAMYTCLTLLPEHINAMRATMPDEFKKDQRIGILLLARVLRGWSDTFKPTPSEWLNARMSMGHLQKQFGTQWREDFDGERPSLLNWLSQLDAAEGYELEGRHLESFQYVLKRSASTAPAPWQTIMHVWAEQFKAEPITDAEGYLHTALFSISAGIELNNVLLDSPQAGPIEILPLDIQTENILDLSVPVRDYMKGWDHFVRVKGREFALERAASHYPEGVPDNYEARATHLKYIETYYEQYERALEPWKWTGVDELSIDKKALLWAWTTSWAPEYTWDKLMENLGVYKPVEAIGRDYTGQSSGWWANAPISDKIEHATTWLTQALAEAQQSRDTGCHIDDFISLMRE